MDDKKTTIVLQANTVPTHGNWEEERSFGQQISPGPQKQYQLYPPQPKQTTDEIRPIGFLDFPSQIRGS